MVSTSSQVDIRVWDFPSKDTKKEKDILFENSNLHNEIPQTSTSLWVVFFLFYFVLVLFYSFVPQVKRSLQPETTTNSPITDAPVTDPPTSNSPTVNSPINTQPTDHQQKTDSPQTTATSSYSNTKIPTAGSASPTLKNFSVIIPVLFTLTFDFLLG